MKTSDFNYDLPEELIAQAPLEDRSSSRLMFINRETNEIKHECFKNIGDYLKKGDCLVINETRVIPARLLGIKPSTGAKIEILLLKRLKNTDWECLVKPGKRLKEGEIVEFGDGLLIAHVLDYLDDGLRLVRFEFTGVFEEILDSLGSMPLPPYIHERLQDKERYQTVYSRVSGSAAAPTAGFHFTKELISELENKGITFARLTLHVGLGTFRPVKEDDLENHHMHSEWYCLDEENYNIIKSAKEKGANIISVGTTSLRALESIHKKNGVLIPDSGWTDIFITPGFEFKVVDKLITNFHLPESTLIMLVSAFYNTEEVIKCYNIAVQEKYRFFSFGDAMFLY